MSSSGLPLLRQDGASIDWIRARYEVEISISGAAASARNRLIDAPELESLVATGDLRYALELRCPRTLYAKVALSPMSEVRCEWNRDEVDGEIFLTPGLVAASDCVLNSGGLNPLWGDQNLPITAGHWLARGMVLRTQSLASSLLQFHKKASLRNGEMEVTPDFTTGDLHFNVWLAPKYFDEVIQHNRDVQIAALIAAFGRIPLLDSDEGESFAVLAHIKAALSEAGVPAWGPELNADFDPARAATAIEAFQIPAPSGDEQ